MVSSLLTLYDTFLDVTLEDGIPQVSGCQQVVIAVAVVTVSI